jgi:hypothetical protein
MQEEEKQRTEKKRIMPSMDEERSEERNSSKLR